MNDDDKMMIVRLEERLANFMAGTIEYRDTLCEKVNDIKKDIKELISNIYSLPCKAREAQTKGMLLREKLLWGAVGGTFGLLVAHLGWK
jgi:hypothetical protein